MEWTSAMFEGITDEIFALLPIILPIALGVFAIGLGLKYAKRVIRLFS